jgi:hypothetical protein
MANKGRPGVEFPALARTTDLPSVIATVNQMKDILTILMNQFDGAMHWVERSRVTKIIRITNPDNPDNWVDVERIMKLTFQNLVTKEIFEWDYLAGPHAADT